MGKAQLYIFDDSEAVIKMTIKGRSQMIRHVSGTHSVALDWLFVSINLDPKIQITHVDTKNQQEEEPAEQRRGQCVDSNKLESAAGFGVTKWTRACDRRVTRLIRTLLKGLRETATGLCPRQHA